MADIIKHTLFTSLLGASALLSQQALANAEDSLKFEAVYNADYWVNTRGGIDEGDAYMDMLDLTLEVDAGGVLGREGGTLFAYALYNNSETFSNEFVGDAQVVSNLDNSHVIRLMEFWYEQEFGESKSLKFGLYDLNSEFDAIESAGLFLNSSHGIGPDYSQTGDNGPSIFPSSSLTLRYSQSLGDRLSYQLAVLDAVPGDINAPQKNTVDLSSDEGALLALEVNYHDDQQRFGLGSWYYTEETGTLDGLNQENNKGFYGIVERTLFTTRNGAGEIKGYARLGLAEKSVNQFANYIGAGLTFSRVNSIRPYDSFGLAVASGGNGSDYRNLTVSQGSKSDSRETNFELTYRAFISDRLVLQPDVQYIINPGTDPALDNALVVGVRAEVKLY
jgi:porin